MKRTMLLLAILFFVVCPASAEQKRWIQVVGEIEKALQGALISYEEGKTNDAMERVADAYFGIFEAEKANMEIAVRRFISLKKATELEKGFGDIRKAMFNKAHLSDIKKQIANLLRALKEAAKELDRKGVGY